MIAAADSRSWLQRSRRRAFVLKGKNISFINHNNTLYFIHYIKPFKLYFLDPETGIIILDEDPQWVYSREGAGNFFELRLDKEYGYVISFSQNDFTIYDFELGGQDNVINILQNQ